MSPWRAALPCRSLTKAGHVVADLIGGCYVNRANRWAKIIEIADERSDEVFRILVSEGQEMSFLPIPEELEGTADMNGLFVQPTSDDADRHGDKYLQTMLDSKA